MDQGAELGSFLRSRRAALRPEDVAVPAHGTRRRVPGLRREELAQLAGVSMAYYTRLEQGQSHNASDAVLDAIARALRLDPAETAHLRDLARPARVTRPSTRPERLRSGLRAVVDSIGDVPAYVVGKYADVLAWNPLAHALLAGHLDADAPRHPADRPNLQRLLFLDPHTRELYADWDSRARTSVACLRLTAGRHPGDPRLAALIGELTMQSPEFAALWTAHPVHQCAFSTVRYRHPLVGELTLRHEIMDLPEDDGQQLFLTTAEPGSSSHAALRLLSGLTAPAPASGQRLVQAEEGGDGEQAGHGGDQPSRER
ncbi:helix-turn-helix domain-containing protein [Amycolatopsis magusensis]|uniref:helix-turn-helix domain-containing protein n=1 Tax=Amycolatopsis magusensis TaxID=882444 RepID=UPI003C2C5C68